MKRKLAVAVGAGVLAAAASVAGAGVAQGSTLACTSDSNHCVGIESNQPVRLELGVILPMPAGGAGAPVVALTPRYTMAEDWLIYPGNDNGVSHIEWAPRGHKSGLCITETRDVRRSQVKLEPCESGVAGVSHQLWQHRDNGPNYNYINLASGMGLAVAGDFNGAPVEVRTQSLGSGNQIFTCIESGK